MFRLAEEVTDSSFLALDRRLQTELVPNQPGFLRRTTARHGDDWLVVTLWSTEDTSTRPRSTRDRRDPPPPGRVRPQVGRPAAYPPRPLRHAGLDVELSELKVHPLAVGRPAWPPSPCIVPTGSTPGRAACARSTRSFLQRAALRLHTIRVIVDHRIGPGASVPAPTPGRWRATYERGEPTTPGLDADVAMPGLRRPAGVRCGLFSLAVRCPEADHRRRQRPGRRGRPRARLLLRPALRRPGGRSWRASHGRLGLPAEYGLSWLLPRLLGVTPGRRPLVVEPGRAGRGGGAARAGQPGTGARRAAAVHLRIRRAARHGDRTILSGGDQLQPSATCTGTWPRRCTTPAPAWPT